MLHYCIELMNCDDKRVWTIQDLFLESFFSNLDGGEMTPECKRTVRAGAVFGKLPSILCLHLKRNNFLQKLNHVVKVTKLIVSAYTSQEVVSSDGNRYEEACIGTVSQYKPIGQIHHYGNSMNSGHYNFYGKCANGSWEYINDLERTENTPPPAASSTVCYVIYRKEQDIHVDGKFLELLLRKFMQ